MTQQRPTDELSLVRDVAARLLPEADEIADEMAVQIHARIPELAADYDGALVAETRSSCRSNVGQVLRGLGRSEHVDHLVTPPEAVEYARGYVRRELPVAVLLRSYRIGQGYFWERWAAAMSEQTADGPALTEALSSSSRWVFDYMDLITTDLVAVYAEARDHWSRTPAALRADTARGLLGGKLKDAREASRLLGYELQRRHHTGLVIWQSLEEYAGDPHGLEAAAGQTADALGAGDSLKVTSGASELWLWCSGMSAPEGDLTERLSDLQLAAGVRIAVGRVGTNLAGFRESHLEAAAAARIAVTAGARSQPVTFYDEVEVVSLMSQDLDRARAFVRHELGGLAGADQSIARLRETMLVLLEEGMSNSRAARRLYVHNNTVVYRAARAQELLGHKLAERRIQVTAALMLTQTLGDSVLPADPA
jgi:hypothetical protein